MTTLLKELESLKATKQTSNQNSSNSIAMQNFVRNALGMGQNIDVYA
jgi:hypothetical protein